MHTHIMRTLSPIQLFAAQFQFGSGAEARHGTIDRCPPPPLSLPKPNNIFAFYMQTRNNSQNAPNIHMNKKSRSVSLNHRGQLFKCHCLGVSFIFRTWASTLVRSFARLDQKIFNTYINLYCETRTRSHQFSNLAFVELFERVSEQERAMKCA